MKTYAMHHVVKGEDANVHGTLFAGQSVKWIVESGFVAVANLTPPAKIVCINMHGVSFKRPVP